MEDGDGEGAGEIKEGGIKEVPAWKTEMVRVLVDWGEMKGAKI